MKKMRVILIANIEYKTKHEQILRRTFNPNDASIIEIENDIHELDELLNKKMNLLHATVVYDRNSTQEDTYDYVMKIFSEAYNSSPFDEKILKNKTVKVVDELRLEDFNYESNFRDALKYYYYILWIIDAIRADYDVLIKKIDEILVKSPINTDVLLNKIYDGDKDYYSRESKIYYLILKYSSSEVISMIENAEKELIDLKVEKLKKNNHESYKNTCHTIKPNATIEDKKRVVLHNLKFCDSLEEAATKANVSVKLVKQWYDYGQRGIMEHANFYREVNKLLYFS